MRKVSGGTVHKLPSDLKKALTSKKATLDAWEDVTPLARNEWICWVVSVKQTETRKHHIERAKNELAEGKRRPCCWMGCIHRKDKEISPSVKGILSKKKRKAS